jgi:phosphopantothenoylcysteine decarboxylase/phosphopantothenate--cysteine ligase
MTKVRATRIVLGVTGSIAAYKAAEIARYFMKRRCVVRVVMTESAEKFISPLTFESITQQPVLRTFWDETQPGAIGHIALADWADAVVVAPASADFIAKAAFGFAESPLLAVLLATKAPVIMAPAMNVNMYEHPQTQENISTLAARGVTFVEPDSGDLACGWKGRGRLAEASEVYFDAQRALGPKDLLGQRVVISTGPTREAIDPVRFISNRSSGKMGIALAKEAHRRGAQVTVVHGPLSSTPRLPRLVVKIPVTSAAQMRDAMISQVATSPDIVIMAAAVADYRPASPSSNKIKKSTNPSSIELSANEDILLKIGEQKGSAPRPFLVGFAVETGTSEELAVEVKRKLERKNADLMVGNLAQDSFDKDTNRVCIVRRSGESESLDTASKKVIARRIFDAIVSKGINR